MEAIFGIIERGWMDERGRTGQDDRNQDKIR
jgi:hypothetical protein